MEIVSDKWMKKLPKLSIHIACLLSITLVSAPQASADIVEVTTTSIIKVDVGFKKLTFNLNPATSDGAFVRDYEVGFKGHYDTDDYGDPSSYCNIPSTTKILSNKTVILCVVDLSGISNDVLAEVSAKGVIIDWVIRGNFEGAVGPWSEPYSVQLYKFPAFQKTSAKSPTSKSTWPNGSIAKCRDGSQRRGACSRHGGVSVWRNP
jgi:hypothetical protein